MNQLDLFDNRDRTSSCTVQAPVVPCSVRRAYNLDSYLISMGFIPYDPRECRRRILAAVSNDTWMEFGDVVDAVKMPIRAVSHMLDLLEAWKRLDSTPMYIVNTGESRFIHPPANRYRGFQFGFRRHNSLLDRSHPSNSGA